MAGAGRSRLSTLAAALLATLAASGCMNLAPPYERPAAPVASSLPIRAGTAEDTPAEQVPELRWNQFYADARLRALITQALASNRDLRSTALAVEAARVQLRLARAAELPVLDLGVAVARQRSGGQTETGTTVELGISAFELDLFGRLRNQREEAAESALAAEESLRSARISLVAEVAAAYAALLADSQRLRFAEETFASQQKSLELTMRTFGVGSASGLDVAQARTSVETARADRATYRTAISQDLNALELLVGQPLDPATLGDLGVTSEERLVGFAQGIGAPAGLSSELLLRRPDVLAAERSLRAANVNIGAARAARFPKLSLTTSVGQSSTELMNLFSDAAAIWTFLPALSVTLFDGGTAEANVRSAEVARDTAVASYEKTIQTAFREVADALAQRRDIEELLSARQALVAAGERSYQLTEARYRRGLDSSLALLDAQRSLVSARQNLISARLVEANNLITLYRVLGGGWGE